MSIRQEQARLRLNQAQLDQNQRLLETALVAQQMLRQHHHRDDFTRRRRTTPDDMVDDVISLRVHAERIQRDIARLRDAINHNMSEIYLAQRAITDMSSSRLINVRPAPPRGRGIRLRRII